MPVITAVAIKRLPSAKELPLPAYQTNQSAGMDLCAAINDDVIINPGRHTVIPSGFSIALPAGYEAQVRPRSGLAAKNGVTVLNSPGTIDADYRGEVGVILINHGAEPFTVSRGLRIAQLIIAPVRTVMWDETETLPNTERGASGFGSTGVAKGA